MRQPTKLEQLVALFIITSIPLLWTQRHAAAIENKDVLNDWFALGSGCKAKHDTGGDVTMKRFAAKDGEHEVYIATFYLDHFALSTANANGKSLNFGKECAIRLNINPPPNKVIKRIYAETELAASKDQDAALLLNSELKLGSVSLGYKRKIYNEGKKLNGAIQRVNLDTSLAAVTGFEEMPKLGCGEAKIIGYDFTLITKRKNKNAKAQASLAGEKTLVIKAELEDCKA